MGLQPLPIGRACVEECRSGYAPGDVSASIEFCVVGGYNHGEALFPPADPQAAEYQGRGHPSYPVGDGMHITIPSLL